jgi:hypothetical protein
MVWAVEVAVVVLRPRLSLVLPDLSRKESKKPEEAARVWAVEVAVVVLRPRKRRWESVSFGL